MIRLKRILMALMVLSTVLLAFADEEEKILRLKLGQEDLKEKVMEVSADTIYSAEKGNTDSFC